MTAATDTRLRGRTRWSAASKCSKWATMALLGFEPEEPSARTRRLWRRGRQIGAAVADDIANEYGENNIIREKAVEWPANGLPLGELHTDVYIIPKQLPVEIKSSTSPQSLIDDAFTQLAGEIHFDPEAEGSGLLGIADPTGWNETEFLPFLLTDEWRDKVERIAADIADAVKTGTLPACSCDTPGACRSKGCPFTSQAWEGWEPPPAEQLGGEFTDLFLALWDAERAYKAHKVEADQADKLRRELHDQLVQSGLHAGTFAAAGIQVKLIEIAGRETFSMSTARKAGIWTPEHDATFGSFVKRGDPYLRWTVSRVGETSAEDFDSGGLPF